MGSHSVACHPAEVTFQPLPQAKPVLDLATPERCKAELCGIFRELCSTTLRNEARYSKLAEKLRVVISERIGQKVNEEWKIENSTARNS